MMYAHIATERGYLLLGSIFGRTLPCIAANAQFRSRHLTAVKDAEAVGRMN